MKKLKCHCGSVEAQINVEKLVKTLKCNCSICKRKSAIMSMVKNEDFKITKAIGINDDKTSEIRRSNLEIKNFFSKLGIFLIE